MQVLAWTAHQLGEPLVQEERQEKAGPDEVLVRVAGCGVCHTDLGFLYDGVPTHHPFPLTLGHEVSGVVVEAGMGAESWQGKNVIVPAVIPCSQCEACQTGHAAACAKQIFPGNDVHGGFATHLRVPANGLCEVPELANTKTNPEGLELSQLSVIADAVSTPYQAVLRSGLSKGDVAIFVGAGGVGGFGVQIAAARGAEVVAIDVSPQRLGLLTAHGASLTLRADETSFKDLRKAVRGFAKEHRVPSWRQKIFETSGTPEGQATAFGLLGLGGFLSVIGYTPKKVELRLSNLMALDATAQGNWGCLPEHYPAVLDLVLSGKVALAPFVERRPLGTINETLTDLRQGKVSGRVILVPEN